VEKKFALEKRHLEVCLLAKKLSVEDSKTLTVKETMGGG
jgi:hypothetical protein